jgi:ribonuclease BN (tRNA processing enzyme)
MRVQVLPAGPCPGHALTGLLIDGVLAVDAGPLGVFGPVDEQARVADVLLTHSHIDHVAGLPVFLDNVYRVCPDCPTVHAQPETLHALQSDLFNDRLMPDFIGMSRTMSPFVKVSEVHPPRPFAVGRYAVTPLPVKHTVPTVGYLIDDREAAVAVVTDTLPVPDVFEPLARWPRLRAVFLECSFPRRLADLAALTHHHATDDFLAAARRLPADVPVYAIHIKPRFWDEVTAELRAAGLPNVRVGEPGMTYTANGGT